MVRTPILTMLLWVAALVGPAQAQTVNQNGVAGSLALPSIPFAATTATPSASNRASSGVAGSSVPLAIASSCDPLGVTTFTIASEPGALLFPSTGCSTSFATAAQFSGGASRTATTGAANAATTGAGTAAAAAAGSAPLCMPIVSTSAGTTSLGVFGGITPGGC